jgi:protein-S-isoprenylcysteine O-methyltransferase Ste14
MTLAAPAPNSAGDHERGARIVPVPPPLYFAAAFTAGIALRGTGDALNVGTGPATVAVGATVVAAGAALAGAGIAQVRRARTTMVPHRPVNVLLTSGVYRLSRNPMYAGLGIVYVGGTLLSQSWWPLLTFPVAVVAIRMLVIGPEERYLAARFGGSYRDYRRRTARWLDLTSLLRAEPAAGDEACQPASVARTPKPST